MNKTIVALLLTASSAFSVSALALGGGNSGDLNVMPQYISWCSNDNRSLSQITGSIQVLDDCASKGKTCQEVEVKKPHVNQIYALCK
ncbi:MAG: hypothetical protein EOP06_23980 [Proteobacteria bacterium]|nr:MAG: hypothetical protein EOP06_23980 [Pseudomonadota bacterium]